MKALKILFADDDLKYSMLLKRFLEAEGYEVTYAGNGRIALEQFPAVKPDLVLLDINMPELNGFEVAEHIRALDRNVLLFFLSDRSDKADRLKGFDLRANDYLAKPFYPEELLARIRERFQCGDDMVRRKCIVSGIQCLIILLTKYAPAITRLSSLRVRQRYSGCLPKT